MLKQAHIAEDVLLDYAENRTDASTSARVRAHLDTGCAKCAAELAAWYRVLPVLESGKAPALPQAELQRAFDLFDRIERKPTIWQRLQAALVFDSRTQPLLAGARDLDRWNIAGQVLASETPELGWKVLAIHPQGQAKTDTDALGEFRLQGLEPGVYDLTLQDLDREIVLPNIVLQAP